MARALHRFLEMYRGSSFPTRSETTDGTICVVKMRGAGNGAGALLSEFVVNRLAARAGLPVPDVFVLEIALGFPWTFGTDEFHDLVQKSPGANLALAWLDGTRLIRPETHATLPADFVSQVVTLDLIFANCDRSVRSGNLLEDAAQRRWIVDHGSCRFLFQTASLSARALPPDHIFFERADAFDAHWLKPITPSLIAETVAEIPDLWLEETHLSRSAIHERIAAVLRR